MRATSLVLVLVVPLAACGASGSSGTATGPAAAAVTKPAYFDVPQAQMSHVQVVAAATTSWATVVKTTGAVDWDGDHTTQAITQVSGPVTRLAADLGQIVKAGDPLLYVASPDLTNAISTYRKAKNRDDLAQRTLERSRDLLTHKAIAQRDLEAAEADANDASTDLQNALQALKILGVVQADLDAAAQQNVAIRPELAMRAPIGGTVVQRLVLPGQVLQAGATVAFVISDVSTVWVQGRIYDKDLTSVHVGDAVEVRAPDLPGPYHGSIASIDRLLDPATRTTLVRIVTPNANGLLRKDLFVDLTIQDHTHRDVLAVPTAAVLYDDENLPFVYLQVDAGKFAQRLVKLGAANGDQTEIIDGLKAGDRLVAQGSLFLQFANSLGH
jgi:cobalt-zinc-cadmium efflux system membrane fusion protein